MPQNTASFTIEDYDFEKSKTGVNIGPLTVTNFTAKRAAIDDYKAAIPGIILGEIRQSNINETFAESSTPVTDTSAQREAKWLVTLRDVTQFFDVGNTINNPGFGDLFSVEVPTADLSLLADNADTLVLTDTAVAAFITALEAVANSPTGGNECEVVSIRHVGRNL
jgi:hypothetical protein